MCSQYTLQAFKSLRAHRTSVQCHPLLRHLGHDNEPDARVRLRVDRPVMGSISFKVTFCYVEILAA